MAIFFPFKLHFLFICFCHFGPILPLNFLFFLIGTNQFERQTFEFMAQEFARRRHKVVTVKPILISEEPRLVCPVCNAYTPLLSENRLNRNCIWFFAVFLQDNLFYGEGA